MYEGVELEEDCLTIPHKYILERPFVTIPLTEIAPEQQVRGVKISTIAKHHSELEDKCLKIRCKVGSMIEAELKMALIVADIFKNGCYDLKQNTHFFESF